MKLKLDVIMNREDLVRRLREDTSSGAAQIMDMTVECLLFMSSRLGGENPEQFFETMTEFGCELISAQPSMAPIFNTVNTLILVIESELEEGKSTKELQQRLSSESEIILRSSEEALAKIQENVI